MLKMFKFLIFLAGILGLAYFVFMVPLGKKTLYEHLVLISKTDEAKKLEEELENKAKELSSDLKNKAADVTKAKNEIKDKIDKRTIGSDGAEHSNEDRQELEELIHESSEPDNADKKALNELIKNKRPKTD